MSDMQAAANLGVLFNTDRLDRNGFLDYAKRVDDLGFESLWLPELFTRDPFTASAYILANTKSVNLATGIANLYGRDPVATVTTASTLQEMSENRFILGLGVSNAGLNRARGHAWVNPVSKLKDYLQTMSEVKMTTVQAPFPVHVAAHGPKMLATVAELADGANTYLMPADHVNQARKVLGGKTLNTMLFCLLDENPETARATIRKAVGYYMSLDYYHRAWRTFGFTDADFANGGSDQLIDAIVAWGSIDTIRARLQNQTERGANRIVIIPLGAGMAGQPDWRLLELLSASLSAKP
jgi:probable F420-dependent oxidoreductase